MSWSLRFKRHACETCGALFICLRCKCRISQPRVCPACAAKPEPEVVLPPPPGEIGASWREKGFQRPTFKYEFRKARGTKIDAFVAECSVCGKRLASDHGRALHMQRVHGGG